MMSEAGITMDLFVGDCERLPIASDQLDFVFISAAMHHTNFLRALAREMARVLKPGGMALIANEPTRAVFDDEADLLVETAEPELRHGITERRPTTAEYLRALTAAGLEVTDVFLGYEDSQPGAIWQRLLVPALIPPRQEWLNRGARRRFIDALKVRGRHIAGELD